MNPDSYVPESSDSALNRLPVSEKARGSGIRPGSQAAVLNIPEPRQPLETSGVSGLQNVNHLGENRFSGKLVDRLTLMALRHCRHRAELRRNPPCHRTSCPWLLLRRHGRVGRRCRRGCNPCLLR